MHVAKYYANGPTRDGNLQFMRQNCDKTYIRAEHDIRLDPEDFPGHIYCSKFEEGFNYLFLEGLNKMNKSLI